MDLHRFPTAPCHAAAGTADLSRFPRALILGSRNTAWLHAFGMETKEHMPWIASMLTTAVAFIADRYRRTVLTNPAMRRMSFTLLAVSLAIVTFGSLLGVCVNKVAPLD